MPETTGTIDGNLFGLYVGGVYIGCTTSNGFSLSRELIESVCKTAAGTSERSVKAGTLTGEFTVTGNWRFVVGYGIKDILTAMLAKTEVTVRFSTESVDDTYIEGSCFITACSGTADVDTDTTFDTTFTLNGDPTVGVVV